MKIFMPLVGQFTNIGDTLHRSVLVDWLKDLGELHIFIGSAPQSFMTGLYLPSGVVIYKSFPKWIFAAVCAAGYSSFFYNPGEITGSKKRFLKEVVIFPVLLLYRILGRKVLKVGVDVQQNGGVNDILFRVSNIFTSYSFYRTRESFCRFGRGEVIPDLGFYKYTDTARQVGGRSYISVSMRADKFIPSNIFVGAVVEFAKANGLAVALVSQVRMDNSSCRELSVMFKDAGCEVAEFLWSDRVVHAEQEAIVNEVYQKSFMVVSDRLHVLIAASNHGAIPICISSYLSDKVEKHFSVIDYGGLVYDFTRTTHRDLVSFMSHAAKRGDELNVKMSIARSKLRAVKGKVFELLVGRNA